MLVLIGDTHGPTDIAKVLRHRFPFGQKMTKSDQLLILGDTWIAPGAPGGEEMLDLLERQKFTTLFIDGNHEYFDALDQMPVQQWHGGRVHVDGRWPSVIHLMRGELYCGVSGLTIWAMGGAASDPNDTALRRARALMGDRRYPHSDRELPSPEEIANGRANLAKVDRVDLIVTHCFPLDMLVGSDVEQAGLRHVDEPNRLTDFLGEVYRDVEWGSWACGHYHQDVDFGDVHLLYNTFAQPRRQGRFDHLYWQNGHLRNQSEHLDKLPAWADETGLPQGWNKIYEGFAYELQCLSEDFGFAVEKLTWEDNNGALELTPVVPDGLSRIVQDELLTSRARATAESEDVCKICGGWLDVECYTSGKRGGFFCKKHAAEGLSQLESAEPSA